MRAEVGCLEYGAAVDVDSGIPVQVPPRDTVVIVVEKWQSLDALKAHLQAPHMADYRSKVKDAVVSAKLQILQPV